ncbi:hypothetical protein [Aggregatibacter actinomycetemcomitans]|uniref:hypothetical protein n=1 Tax=Aggregatibacter actinomycetemcomitans TaxID=714 RepID=UPI002150D9FD|nr:hypothetical protein [Aggregatibacter actinomycetemcomitans]
MRFSTYINNQKALEWGLNANQAALLDYLISIHKQIANTYAHWEKMGVILINISYQDICNQLPLYYKKTDTAYKALKALIYKDLIINHRISIKNRIECISISTKAFTFLEAA